MKLIMERWLNYQNEMRDRYLPPGEDPSDPTPDEEREFEELSDKASEFVDDSEGNPNQLVKVSDDMFIKYDPNGEQFLVYSSLESAENEEHDDLYYREETENLEDVIIDKLKQGRDVDFDMEELNMENFEKNLSEKVKNKIMEQLSGGAGAAIKKAGQSQMAVGLNFIKKKVEAIKSPAQKVEFILQILPMMGVTAEDMVALSSKIRTTAQRQAKQAPAEDPEVTL